MDCVSSLGLSFLIHFKQREIFPILLHENQQVANDLDFCIKQINPVTCVEIKVSKHTLKCPP